jgi:hypothetical protein
LRCLGDSFVLRSPANPSMRGAAEAKNWETEAERFRRVCSLFASAARACGLTLCEHDERVAMLVQFGDEQGEEISEPF